MAEVEEIAGPVPLHLPAILQNPKDKVARQVEAHNAHQRDKVQARKERLTRSELPGAGKGKRVIRRKDNATFASNPHITLPRRSDYYPTVPFQSSRLAPVFPPGTIPRSSSAPDVTIIPKDPFSADSRSGGFSTSLKGVRALLRKRGRRAETLVGTVDDELRRWLAGDGWVQSDLSHEKEDVVRRNGAWRIVDPVSVPLETSDLDTTSTAGPSKRLPSQHRIDSPIPPLPVDDDHTPAVLELSRSPAHVTWVISDGFERLVVHLLARYYELVSWSEDHLTVDARPIRLTHIIVPHIVRPPPLPASHMLPTPVNSDLSAASASDTNKSQSSYSDAASDFTSEISETETEIGYSLEPEPDPIASTPHEPLPDGAPVVLAEDSHTDPDHHFGPTGLDTLDLERTVSNGSSAFGSSEADSDWGSMGDSLTLPPPNHTPPTWTSVTSDGGASDDDFVRIKDMAEARSGRDELFRMQSLKLGGSQRTWDDRPTFFEYLYGD